MIGLHGLRAVLGPGDERRPLVEPLAAVRHERLVDETLGHHDVCHRIDDGDVRSRLQLQVVIGLDVRRAHQVDATRVDHDEVRALTQPLLHPRREHRVPVGRVGPDHHDDVGLRHRLEVLRARRLPKVCLSPYPVGEWHTRAHVSTLLLPNAARTIFCTT